MEDYEFMKKGFKSLCIRIIPDSPTTYKYAKILFDGRILISAHGYIDKTRLIRSKFSLVLTAS